jgi:hypothetical protein
MKTVTDLKKLLRNLSDKLERSTAQTAKEFLKLQPS